MHSKRHLPWDIYPTPTWVRTLHGVLYQILDLETGRLVGTFVGESREVGLHLNYNFLSSAMVIITLC